MQIKKSSLFTSTGWWRQFNGFYFTLSAISGHHSWLEMAPRERQKPFHFLHTSEGKEIIISHSKLYTNDEDDGFDFLQQGLDPCRQSVWWRSRKTDHAPSRDPGMSTRGIQWFLISNVMKHGLVFIKKSPKNLAACHLVQNPLIAQPVKFLGQFALF